MFNYLGSPNGLITSVQITDGGILGTEIAANTISNTRLISNSITSTEINTGAAIPYSKLSLANTISNTDISTTAAIAYSKLSLGTSIVNGDIATNTIANTKLLAATITGAEIAAATIGNAKLSNSAGDIAGAWVSFTPTTTNITSPTIAGRHITIGKTYSFRIVLSLGTVTSGASDVIITLPVTASSALGGLYPVNVIGALGITTYAYVSAGGGNIIFRNQINGITTSTGGGIFGSTTNGGATNTAFNIFSGNTYVTGANVAGTTISGTIELA